MHQYYQAKRAILTTIEVVIPLLVVLCAATVVAWFVVVYIIQTVLEAITDVYTGGI